MQCHQNSDNDAREKANRNEHIGNGVLIFVEEGMTKRQTEVCQKHYSKETNYATL